MSKERKNTLILSIVPGLFTLIFYLKTVCPTVYSGDSGELALATYVLGIAHPPGYPILTLIGRLVLAIIPANPAYTLNILSGIFSSAAVGIGALIFRRILFDKERWDEPTAIIISALGAILFGFSNALWATSVGFEVYSLGILLIFSSLLCLLNYIESGNTNLLIGAAYLMFLGLTNHLSAAVVAIPILFSMIRARVPLRIWLTMAGLFVLAISAYLYIPIRSANNPIADWNHPANFRAFYEHVTARRYSEYITGVRFDNYFQNFWRSITILLDQFPLFIGLIGLAGLYFVKSSIPKIRIILLSMILFNLLIVPLYDIPDIDQYYLITIFVSVLGLGAMIYRLLKIKLESRVGIYTAAALSVVLLITIGKNYKINNQTENKLAFDYGMNILNSVPQNSILISVGDNANSSVYYLHYVEGMRPDLEIYDIVKTVRKLKEKLGLTGTAADISGPELCLQYVSANPDRSYLVKEHMLIRGLPFDYYNLKLTPQGMVYRWGTWPQNLSVWNKLSYPILDSFSSRLEFKAITMLANLYLCKGEDIQASGDTSSAYNHFSAAAEIATQSSEASLHNSLGVFFRHEHWLKLSEREYGRALSSLHLTGFERANIYVNLGNLSKDRGNFTESIDYYNKALKINKNNRDALYNLALAQAYQSLQQHDYKSAAANFETALPLSNNDPRLMFNLGVLYDQNLHDTVRAIENYNRFARQVPGMPEAQAALRRIEQLKK
jgi:tetratricopeptide (TPR) repeat protein